ncbi:hypothetical protein GCM10010384_21680 [Streptomyces djakartensis]|uniref:Uncharacterized protein n=1 Tax=Streptomyces djakartensis TaxID=68193 RepID=A0ABQ2ZG06_9ACTN|nr:hypothetical protein GCM10010384_21680 [Streptomyces djakartensis]
MPAHRENNQNNKGVCCGGARTEPSARQAGPAGRDAHVEVVHRVRGAGGRPQTESGDSAASNRRRTTRASLQPRSSSQAARVPAVSIRAGCPSPNLRNPITPRAGKPPPYSAVGSLGNPPFV